MTGVATRAGSADYLLSPSPDAKTRGAHRPVDRKFRPDIQGLRAVAVGLVVASHCGLPFFGGGYVGVDVFFVISGFLITAHLLEELVADGRIRLARFYARRMLRLLPVSSLVVIATLFAAYTWWVPLRSRGAGLDALSSSLYVINIRLAELGTDYMHAASDVSAFQHFWSLAVEEQFYLCWPLLLLAGSLIWWQLPSRHAIRQANIPMATAALVALTIGSLVVSTMLTQQDSPWAYFGLQSRAWELGIGALVAVAATQTRRLADLDGAVAGLLTWSGLAAIGAAGFFYSTATRFPGVAALLPVLGAAAVIAGGCAAPRAGAETVLRLWPMQQIGKVSYGWYLWHWPFLMFGPIALGVEAPGGRWKLTFAAGALAVALLSLYIVEDPVRNLRALKAKAPRGLAVGAALTALSAAVALTVVFVPRLLTSDKPAPELSISSAAQLGPLLTLAKDNTVVPRNITPTLDAALDDGPHTPGACNAEYNVVSTAAAFAAGCNRFGDPNGKSTVVLFGDSHAYQWFGAINEIARQRGQRLVVLTKQACSAAWATLVQNSPSTRANCVKWRDDAFEQIEALHPDQIVMTSLMAGGPPVGARAANADPAWADAWSVSFRRLHTAGIQVTFLEDTAKPPVDVPTCLSGHLLSAQECAGGQSAMSQWNRRGLIRAAAYGEGISVIDTLPWLCIDAVCPPIVGNVLVYRDASHITDTYARALAPVLDRSLPSTG
jgi:peptidoglycan/LPS O-acetylase OafA/YrhL